MHCHVPDSMLTSGRFDDTICPLDFESHGQIDSDTVRDARQQEIAQEAELALTEDSCIKPLCRQ